jgi:hypothetical protein
MTTRAARTRGDGTTPGAHGSVDGWRTDTAHRLKINREAFYN